MKSEEEVRTQRDFFWEAAQEVEAAARAAKLDDPGAPDMLALAADLGLFVGALDWVLEETFDAEAS